MTTSTAEPLDFVDEWARPTGWKAFRLGFFRFMTRKKLGAGGLIIVIFFTILAVAAPVISPYDPEFSFDGPNPDYKTNPTISELAQNPDIGSPRIVVRNEPPGSDHWFGTDSVGRDTFSRVIYGSRLSLIVGLGASFIAVLAGLVLGLSSGFYRGWLDLTLQRFVDALQAFPALVLLLLLIQIAEPSVRNTVIAMGIIGVPVTTRLIRSAVLGTVSRDYILAARTVGASDMRIMVRHVVPNVAAILLISFSIGIGAYILFEATISFLGVGPRGVVSWGKMVQEGRAAIDLHPWLSIFAGGAIALLVMGFNFLGDALRDVLDPRTRGAG